MYRFIFPSMEELPLDIIDIILKECSFIDTLEKIKECRHRNLLERFLKVHPKSAFRVGTRVKLKNQEKYKISKTSSNGLFHICGVDYEGRIFLICDKINLVWVEARDIKEDISVYKCNGDIDLKKNAFIKRSQRYAVVFYRPDSRYCCCF